MLPLLPESSLQTWRNDFLAAENSFPEYDRVPGARWGGSGRPYVMEGFCAYGNPGPFHNKFARSLRYLAHQKIVPVLMSLIALYYPALTKIEQLIDRMRRRPKQVCCTANNQWHRDISGRPLEPLDTDQIFGGRVNLDNGDQYFRCVPESH